MGAVSLLGPLALVILARLAPMAEPISVTGRFKDSPAERALTDPPELGAGLSGPPWGNGLFKESDIGGPR